MKDLSVIIVTHNGWKRLVNCLNSLGNFSGDHFSMEVIVVDNDSDGHIMEIKKGYPAFRFIHNNINGGFANGCNLGAGNAIGEFLLFLNPDTVVMEMEISKLLKSAKNNPDFHLVACRQTDETGKFCRTTGEFPSLGTLTGFQRSLAMIFKSQKIERDNSDVLFPDWVSGSVMMIKKDLFSYINGFDEDFWMYFEDVDICRRIHDNGGKIAYLRNITIEHNHGGSSRANMRVTAITKAEVLISQHVYVTKHFSGRERYFAILFLVLHNILVGFLSALLGCLFFFIPKVYVNTLIFMKLIRYYAGVISRGTWVGTRSLNVRRLKDSANRK